MSQIRCEEIPVVLGERSYVLRVGAGAISLLGQAVKSLSPSAVCLVTDERVAALHSATALASLREAGLAPQILTFPAGEASKSWDLAGELLGRVAALGLDRRACLVALGGGVTGDLAGFVAASYMRGIRFVQVPTTLLAQVDSSIGGKTGVNLPCGKNLVGAFHQPAAVLADVATLSTLPAEELVNGLAEVVKHGVILDADYFTAVERDADRLLARDPAALQAAVAGSCRIKAAVVAADERESGLRALLNLGHTFGHAWETVSRYAVPHGSAVALGMLAACRLAQRLRGLDPGVRARLAALLARLGLPVRPPVFPGADLLAAMRGDKKAEGGTIRFVLPTRIGGAEVVPVRDEAAILAALETWD